MGEPCSIIAMEIVTALGVGTQQVWAEMMHKTCGIRLMNRFARGKYRTDVAGEISAEAETAIREQLEAPDETRAYLLALYVGTEALRQAVDAEPGLRQAQTGLVLASTKAEIEELERAVSGAGERGRARYSLSVMAREISARLGLTGPVVAVSNACASGLIGIIQAARMLDRGAAEAMLVIGVDALADFIIAGFSCLGALGEEPCRPYDESRDGLSLGEGAGAFLIVRGRREPGRRLGMIRGWGVSNDATHITAPSRTGEGLKLAIGKALAMSGMKPEDIHYVNGHGTATVFNDAMEAEAISAIFVDGRTPVTSMKGYFGHTLGAAGIVEAALCIEAIREGIIPASLGLKKLGVEKKIRVETDHLRLEELKNVLTVKSGFAGVNAALILTE